MTRTCSRRWGRILLLAAGLLAAAACGSGLPRTHPVKGRVVFKDGDGKLLQGATVEFKSVTDPDISAEGEVQADGTFTIRSTSKDGRTTVEGAVAGEHRVRVIPPNPLEEQGRRLIDPRLQQFETSGLKVKVPGDEEVVLEVYRPRR
jgi:hypothetical protein